MNQQGAQGDITLLADGAELRLAAAGILPWRQDNSSLNIPPEITRVS